jgi:hypothetical protein
MFWSTIHLQEAVMQTTFQNNHKFGTMLKGVTIRRGMAWGLIIIGALVAFEIFNFSTTQFALADVLGNLKFAGMQWSTILALAFCGIDFAGLARLFTPEQGRNEPTEVWYLFGAWILAAAMNATLTWWGVSVAIVDHSSLAGGVVLSNTTLIKVVPVFVAFMVWLIRVLIIGTFSVAGDRLFTQADGNAMSRSSRSMMKPSNNLAAHAQPSMATAMRSASRPVRPDSGYRRPEPTYHNASVSARTSREVEYVDSPRNS